MSWADEIAFWVEPPVPPVATFDPRRVSVTIGGVEMGSMTSMKAIAETLRRDSMAYAMALRTNGLVD